MGASREGRQSEKTYNDIWNCMRSLAIEVWLPRADDAQETAEYMKRRLDQMVAEMKAEAFTTMPGSSLPNENTFGQVQTPMELKRRQ